MSAEYCTKCGTVTECEIIDFGGGFKVVCAECGLVHETVYYDDD